MSACIEFPGARTGRGYGSQWDPEAQRVDYAHRLAWRKANGPIPEGMEVMHDCDNPPCVNIDHLLLGTHAENMADMARKGRADRTQKARGLRQGAHTQPHRRPKGDRHGNTKVSEANVVSMRAAHGKGVGTDVLAQRYGVTRGTVQRIVYGRARA